MVCYTFQDQDERASGTLMGGEDECRHADAGLAAEKGADRRGSLHSCQHSRERAQQDYSGSGKTLEIIRKLSEYQLTLKKHMRLSLLCRQ